MAPKKRKKKLFQHHGHSFLDDNTSATLHDEIRGLFSKKFTLKERQQTWPLPPSVCMLKDDPFIVRELLALKEELNATKSLLNDMDIDEWHQHTRRMHKTGLVVRHLRENAQAEMCTQAWAKFQEILGTYDFIPSQALENKQINTVHLCEAPGAFIACLNHHLKNNVPGAKWQWKGTTLNPYYEGNDLNAMLDDDSFILETRENWNFGLDGTGDLMNLQNLVNLQHHCQSMGQVHLVTADGSINCADEPGEQEQVVSQLILCETLAALELLSEGGNYVFKMFTALEYHMVGMLYLLCCVFEEVHFMKPATSKAGNSEVYIICLTYCGNLPIEYQEILHEVYSSNIPDKALFPLKCFPADFIDRIYQCQQFFISKQKHEIVENIRYFHSMNRQDKQFVYHIRNQAVQHYVNLYNVKPLADADRMVRACHLDGIQRSHNSNVNEFQQFSNRKKSGTYNERHDKTWIDTLQHDEEFRPTIFTGLAEFSKAHNGTQLIPLSPDDVEWLVSDRKAEVNFSFTKGKKITKILNSRLCSSYYITTLNTADEKLSDANRNELCEMLQLAPGHGRVCQHCNYYSIVVLDRLVNFSEGEAIASLLLQKQLPCQCIDLYLQSQGISVSCQSKTVDLVVVPVLDEIHLECVVGSPLELKTKNSLLHHCINALKVLNPGGTFICHVYTSLTRFTVGVLYILHRVFRRVSLIKPALGSLCSSDRFLVCKGYIGLDQNILSSLIESRDRLMTCQPGEDLLELVDIKCLYEEKFFEYVRRNNEQLAHIQLVNIVNRESFDRDIINEQYAVLSKEAMEHFNISAN